MKKKVIRTLLICIVIGCILTSIYFLWPREKQVYQHGIQYTQCPPAEENDWWGSGDSKAFQDAAAAKTVTVSWQGKQYVGEYEYSRIGIITENKGKKFAVCLPGNIHVKSEYRIITPSDSPSEVVRL